MDDRQIRRITEAMASTRLDLEAADQLSSDPKLKREAREKRRFAKKRRNRIRRIEDKLECEWIF
jgi:hypothetical protein